MKKIILVYGDDEGSKKAIKELNFIRIKYQNLFSRNNLQILTILDNSNEKYEAELTPTLILMKTEKNEEIEEKLIGYDINMDNNYLDQILDFFPLRDSIPFPSWIWNEENFKWEAPVKPHRSNQELKWNEGLKGWVNVLESSEEEKKQLIRRNPSNEN